MHHNLIIKNGDATQVEKEILVDGVQFIDKEPVEGSFNPVTSDGVAKSFEKVDKKQDKQDNINRIIFAHIYNPLNLPAKTIRCKFESGSTPTIGTSRILVDEDDNVWDITNNSDNWASLFLMNMKLQQVIGANTSGVTNMNGMFYNCSSLTSVPLFDTLSVTNMNNMFNGCSSLTSVPLFDTLSVTNMNNMFNGCVAVQGGALALYQQASTQETPPTNHTNTFKNCGSNTEIGSAELNQIPTSWGGAAT